MHFFKYLILLIAISLFPSGLSSQTKEKKLDYKKTVEDADCNQCNLDKKNKYCFIVSSYVGNITLSVEKDKVLAPLNEIGYNAISKGEMVEFYFCTTNKYQEIMVSAKDFLGITFALTPADFKNGIPVISIFEQDKDPENISKSKTLFEKMNELENEESSPGIYKETSSSSTNAYDKAEKKIYVQKIYDKTECSYCLSEGKKSKCLIIISGLKSGKLMDGDKRISHTKSIKINDSIRQYIFCFNHTKYKEYTFKTKGYENGAVEVIPNDFARNRTPIYSIYNENQKSYFEQTDTVLFLYSKKSTNRWGGCQDCEKESRKGSCIFIYSHLSDLVLNDEKEVISSKNLESVGPSLKQYTYCVSPETKTLMVSRSGYEPCLLKLKFEDLESIGATAFVVTDNKENLDPILDNAEGLRKEVVIEEPETEPKGKEYRVQLIAKLRDDFDADEIQTIYDLPFEVKEDYDGRWHRFTIGSYSEYTDALKAMNDFKRKYKSNDAFIVLYMDGKRIGPYHL